MLGGKKNSVCKNAVVEMGRQIPGNQGQCSQKQKPRWETRNFKGSKKPDHWGLLVIVRIWSLFSEIDDISLKFFRLGKCLLISLLKILVAGKSQDMERTVIGQFYILVYTG